MCQLDNWINKLIIEAYKNQNNPIKNFDFETAEKVREARKSKEGCEVLNYILKNYYFRGENSKFEFSSASLFRNSKGVKANNSNSESTKIHPSKITFDYIKIIESLRTKDEKIIDTMINWRHSGRISPLIDLTKSLKIALFFACIPQNKECESDGYVKFYHKSDFHIINSDEFSELFNNLSFSRSIETKIGVVIDSNDWVHPNIKKQDSVICFPFSGQIEDSFHIRIPLKEKKLILNELEKYNISTSSIFSGAEGMETSLLLMEEAKTTHHNENCKKKCLFSIMESYNSIYIENTWRKPVGQNEARSNFLNYFSQFLDNNSEDKLIISSILFLLETEFNNSLMPNQWDYLYFGNFIRDTLFTNDNNSILTLLNLNRILTLDKNLKVLKIYIREIITFDNWKHWNRNAESTKEVINKFKNSVAVLVNEFWGFLMKSVQDIFYNKSRNPLKIPIDSIVKMYRSILEEEEKNIELFKNNTEVNSFKDSNGPRIEGAAINDNVEVNSFKDSNKEGMAFLSNITLVLLLCQIVHLYKNSSEINNINNIEAFLGEVLLNIEENSREEITVNIDSLMIHLRQKVTGPSSKESKFVNKLENIIKTTISNSDLYKDNK